MALVFVDRNNKTVLHSWGRFRAPVFQDVVVGDLLALKTGTTYSLQLADSTGQYGAIAVAVQNILAGKTGWCALAAELKAPTTIGTGGVVTQQYFDDDSAMDIGQDLFTKLIGKVDETEGAMVQRVGYNMTRDTILLVPGGSITGAAGSFTSLQASLTLSVSGIATLGNGTDTTQPTDGGTIISGGLGIAKSLFVGGSINMDHTFTDNSGAAHRALYIKVAYEPAGNSGYAYPMCISADLSLGGGDTFTGVGQMTAIEGKLFFLDLSDVDQASAIFAAIKGGINSAGTPTFTDFDLITAVFASNRCDQDMRGGTHGSALFAGQNTGWIDHGLFLNGNNQITNVFCLMGFGGGAIMDDAVTTGDSKRIRVLIEGSTMYMNAYAGA